MFCGVFCTTVVHSDMHTGEQFLNLHIGLGLDFVFVCLFRFTMIFVFCVSLGKSCFCCVGFSFFSAEPRDWLGTTSLK